MLQTLQGKGPLFHMGKDALAPNPRFQKVLLKEGHLSHTASTWRQHNKPEATKRRLRRKDCNTGQWHQSTQGRQRDLGHCVPAWQLWGQKCPWTPPAKQLQSLGAPKLSSGLWCCWKGTWSIKTLPIISQDWQNSHSLKSGCEVWWRLQATNYIKESPAVLS